MGNRVEIFVTKFVDIDLKGNEVETTYGVRICDDHAQAYTAGMPQDEIVGRSPAEIVEIARGIDERAHDMVAFAEEYQDGINIGEEYFVWADIKPKTVTP